jgi:hypothetical protein
MSHPIHRVVSFEAVAPYTLCIHFEDGTEQVIDFEPVLEGEIFAPLRDPELFRQVTIDPEADTLVWPNGADFDPATLYDWPLAEKRLVALARQWAVSAAGRNSAA